MTLYWRILQFGRRKKDHGSPTRCMLKDLSFSYGNLDLAASNSRNTRKFFSYSSAKFCLFQTFCIISSVLFPFKLLLVSLPTLPYPPPNNKSISPGLWCGLHYMSVCIVKPYVLQQWVMRGEGGRREEFYSVQLFSMPPIKKKKNSSIWFCSTK